MDPIERIEVALRASITNHMSVKYEPHWYLDKTLFKDRFDHNGFILKIKNEITEEKKKLNRIIKRIDGSNESIEIKERKKNQEIKQNFLRHYLSKYDTPELPPCWMMVELLSMGQLNMLLDNLARNIDQKNIALPFCVPFPLLISWLRSIQTVRNICAHHGRLWNRELGTPPQLPKTKHLHNRWITQPIKLTDRSINPNIRIYIVLVIIQYLLFAINPGSEWKLRLSNLMKKYPNVSKANMGMPDNWYEEPFWSL
jgi:abortive infection bacteriophage resistance protein